MSSYFSDFFFILFKPRKYYLYQGSQYWKLQKKNQQYLVCLLKELIAASIQWEQKKEPFFNDSLKIRS